MKNNLVGLAVGVVCAIVIVGSVLVPNINNFTQTHDSFTNVGLFDMAEFEDGDVWSCVSETSTWTLNDGDSVTSSNKWVSAILTDTFCIRANGQVRGSTIGGNVTDPTVTVTVADDSTVTVAGTGVNGTATQTYESGYGICESGDYVLIDFGAGAKLLSDSMIYATGITSASNFSYISHIEGTIEDGVTITLMPAYGDTSTALTVSDVQINATAIDGYANLYDFESITFTVTATLADESTATNDTTYNSVIVPKVISAELSKHMSESENALISIIPLFTILAVLCAVTYAVMRNRDY